MTGSGRADKTQNGRDVIAEIRSVNHRYFDYSSRISRGYEYLEENLRPYLQEKVSRGKLDVSIEIQSAGNANVEVVMDEPLAAGYLAALRQAGEKFGLTDDMTASTLLRCPDLFTVRRKAENEEEVWLQVKAVLDEAFRSLFDMRKAEGIRLKEDILSRADAIQEMVGRVEERSPKTVEEYRSQLKERLQVLLGGAQVDEQRLLTEAAIYADKVSVAEETVRLRSHIGQFRKLADSEEAVGRKMDFLVQEMNREANTIGSKCIDADIAHIVVDMKAEIEKIREQIQNIE